MAIYKKRSPSFTLIELIVGLILLVAVVSIRIPKKMWHESLLLTSELNILFSTISFIKQKAISSNTEQQLLFSTRTNSYSYKVKNKNVTHFLSAPIQFGYFQHAMGPPSRPIHQITDAITCKKSENKHEMKFSPDGAITPGTIYLINKNHTMMYALSTPIAAIPFIRTYRYQQGTWVALKK